MFSWPEFATLAQSVTAHLDPDPELRELFSKAAAPPETPDSTGRPLPNAAVITEHAEPQRFRWIVTTRRSASTQDGDEPFIRYADKVLGFFESFGEFSSSNPLIVVLVATHKNEYEFLYAPNRKALTVSVVGDLGNPRRSR